MKMELCKPDAHELKEIKRLYLKAFPACERKPFWLIQRMQNKNVCEIFSVKDGSQFCGLVITLLYDDAVLVDYLAISGELRGKGIGSAVIELIRKKYDGKTIFLEIELEDISAPNSEERTRRKKFYLKNGLHETGVKAFIYGTEMELLTFGENLTYDEYTDFLCRVYGRFLYRFLDPLQI